MADRTSRRRALIVLVLAVLAIAAFIAVLFVATTDDPAADLAARVRAVVPAELTVDITGSDVVLAGEYAGDIDDLVTDVAAIEGVGRVFADQVVAPAPPATSTPPPTVATGSTIAPLELDAPTFTFRMDRNSVELAGLMPDEAIIEEVERSARRLFGRNSFMSELRVGIVDGADWVTGLPIAVASAVNMETFELNVDGSGATISGVARDQESADQIVSDLTLALGFAPQGTIAVRDLADQLTALLRGVATFETGSAVLSEEGKAVLDEAAALLLGSPGVIIRVEGHTDSVGSAAANQLLSEERAQAVVDYLVEQGVEPDQLGARGFGETQPIADNATEEGRAMNRRIEFVVGG